MYYYHNYHTAVTQEYRYNELFLEVKMKIAKEAGGSFCHARFKIGHQGNAAKAFSSPFTDYLLLIYIIIMPPVKFHHFITKMARCVHHYRVSSSLFVQKYIC